MTHWLPQGRGLQAPRCTHAFAGESTPQWKNPLGTPADEAAEDLALAGRSVPIP